MRILVISNLYPPLHLGGYELGCADVVDALRKRGHEVAVLTSRYGVDSPRAEGHVHRLLWFRPASTSRPRLRQLQHEFEDQRTLARMVTAVKPDVIYAFSFYGISTALLLAAQRLGPPVTYAFSAEWLEPGCGSDPWLAFWREDATTPVKRLLKRAARHALNLIVPTGLAPLDVRHAYFTSRRLRDLYLAKGFPVQAAEVIHWGVDLGRFRPRLENHAARAPHVLFAGRIAREKGLHTVIEALALLRDVGIELPLDVAGPVQDTNYSNRVRLYAGARGLDSGVRFLGPVPCEDMPALYRAHDIYVLPSLWEEPFSIGLLEAMATGLAVVATPTGGTPEALSEGVNGLAFTPGDARALADRLKHLLDAELRRRLGAAARRTVKDRFDMAAMSLRIEAHLEGVVGARG